MWLVKHTKRESKIVLNSMAAKKLLVGEFSGTDISKKGTISYLYNCCSIKQIIFCILKRNPSNFYICIYQGLKILENVHLVWEFDTLK